MDHLEWRRPKGLGGLQREGLLRDDTPQHVFISSADDRERAYTMGVEAYRTGRLMSVRPVMSKGDYANLKFASRPAATGHEGLMFPFIIPGTEVWRKYMETRKIVESVDSRGRKTATVVSNMYEKLQKLDDASAVVKVYRLTQVLTDATVQRKFSMTVGAIRSLRAVAIVRPSEAAKQATDMMTKVRPDLGVVVTSEGYSTSRRAAKQTVEEFCSRFPRLGAADDCSIIGPDLFIFGPGEQHDEWHVSGPLIHAHEVALVFRAVESCGPQSVMFSLGSELVTLKIDIALRGSYLSPDMEYHVGGVGFDLPEGSSPLTTSLLSSDGRAKLERMRAAVVEVRRDGVLVASCVRISDKYYIVGGHVLAGEGSLTVDGQPLRAVRTVAPDLWLVEAQGPSAPVWPMRDAREGERVVVCYRGPTGSLQYTSPLSVITAGPQMLALSTSVELTKGMSGGAIVALEDLALLGVYEGSGRQQALGLVFSPTMFAEVHSVSGHTAESRVDELGVLQKMRDRGLGSHVDSVLSAVTPLYSGSLHVGHCYGVSGRCYTTSDPDVGPLSLTPGGQPLVFSEPDGFWYSAACPGLPAAAVARKPNYFERVVVVGRDLQGPYYSSVARVVHIGVGANNFSIEGLEGDTGLPFEGGLIMSLVDGAVLGVRVRQSVSANFGVVEFCVSLPSGQPKKGGRLDGWLASVRAAFPMVRPGAWPAGVLEEVFGHSSMQRYSSPGKVFNSGMAPLAYVGSSALKLRFGQLARGLGLPYPKWQRELDRVLSTVAVAGLSDRFGFVELVEFGAGVAHAPSGSKVYSDVLLALVGAVRLCEVEAVYEEFADAVLSALGSVVVAPLGSPEAERRVSVFID